MDIVDKIENSGATIQQLSILTGIPADRIYKWRKRKSSPAIEDIISMEKVFQLLSNSSKDEIKKLINAHIQQKKLKNNSQKAPDEEPNNQDNVNKPLLSSQPTINQWDENMNMLSSLVRTEEINASAAKELATAAVIRERSHLMLVEIMRNAMGIEELKKASGM